MVLKSVCVYCGSSSNVPPIYFESARRLGRLLAERDMTLVYGGASVGLMGALADAVLDAGGKVVGVIPYALQVREVAHPGLTDLHVVSSMHERKALMAELADGFVALPGGIGTLDEFFEAWTWAVLGVHRKPCAFLDVNGFYASLLAFIDQLVAQRFLREEHRSLVFVETDPEALLTRLSEYQAPDLPRWIDKASS